MIFIGCGGNPSGFYKQGGTSSLEMPEYLNSLGLNAYEYSCKKGIKITDEAAEILKNNKEKFGIRLSVHAPYGINLAADNEALYVKSLEEGKLCMDKAYKMGAERVVFHNRGSNNLTRYRAFDIAENMLSDLLEYNKSKKYDLYLCPEISGKQCEFGNLEETVKLCMADESLMPAINFGHLNAREGGSLKSAEAFEAVYKKIMKKLGSNRAENFHCHFSKISYTNSGEKEHLTFKDREYGPEFEPFEEVLAKYKLTPMIICESHNTQDEDAIEMLSILKRRKP